MKVKNTFVKGKLNKDVDERLVPNGEYIHSENIMVSDSSTSDIGALENARGNEKLTELNLINGVAIGSYTDEFNQKIYWFVTSDDKDMVLEYNVEDDILEVLLESDNGLLNFNNSYLITGIVKIINGDPERDLLLWTDDLNPPRVINIERAKTYGLNGFNQDTISLIKKPPRFSPNVTLTNIIKEDELNGEIVILEPENNLENKFLSFAYRYKYLDGEYSALSSFTDYQFIPKGFDLDYNTLENNGMINSFNSVIIGFNTGSNLVTDIQLVFKLSNSNNIYLIETLNKENKNYIDNDSTQSFIFSSNKIYRILPEDEIFRQYDNVPRLSKSLELIGNRLVFGNYVDGYNLKDNLEDPVNIDLELSLKTEALEYITIPYTINGTQITLNLSNVDLTKDYLLNLELRLDESVISRIIYPTIQDLRDRTNPPQVYSGEDYNEVVYISQTGLYYQWTPNIVTSDNGTTIIDQINTPNFPVTGFGSWIHEPNYTDTNVLFNNSFQYILKKDYNNISDLLDITDYQGSFTEFVEVFMTNRFFSLLQGETPEYSQTTPITTGFQIVGSTATSITIESPTREYIIDTTPLIPADPSNDVNVIADYIYNNSSKITYTKTDSTKSLKSNRSYEVGVVYYDEYNRASTVLTNDTNSIYISAENSAYKNQLKINLKNNPPYWADRYKIVVKQNKKFDYHIIYCTIYYNDGLYRWVKIESGSKDKIAVGNTLIVKSDSSGILERLVKTKVLEIEQQPANFLPNAESGLYIKIKPVNFELNEEKLEFISFEGTQGLQDTARLYTQPFFGRDNGGGFTLYDLLGGSKVRVFIKFQAYGAISFEGIFDERFIVQEDYIADVSVGGIQKWFIDNVQTKQSFIDFSNNYMRDFGFTPDGKQFFVWSKRDGTAARDIYTTIKIEILFAGGTTVFETEASDSDNDIFYETEQTFEIINNNHQGNIQNQNRLTNTNAILELSFFNCYIQGRGAESYRFKDAFSLGIDTNGNKIPANYLNLDLRPTAKSLDDYKEVRRYADLTYSEPYNENSNINGLNEFNLSKANYKEDIDKKYGFIQKLYSRDTDLLVFQENKISKVLFGKDLLLNADGTSNLSSIEDVLGQQITYMGEYGISNNPESFAYNGFAIYFTDSRRGAVMRLAGDGLNEISKLGLTQFFKDQFRNTNNIKKIGGFDPYNDQYVLYTTNSLTDPSIDSTGHYTISFEEGVKGWASFHTFYPEYMIGINNNFYTFKNGDLYLHHSDNVDRCNFYGIPYPSKVSFSLNEAPSDIKELKAVSIEGSSSWDTYIKAHISNLDDFTQSTIRQEEYVKKEGFWYAYARRNENILEQDSKSSYGIGKIQTIIGNIITVNGYSDFLISGDKLMKGSDCSIIGDIISSSRNGNITTIVLSTTTGLLIDDFVLGIKNSRIDGGNLRGYTMRYDLEITNPTKVELFAVNSEIFKSYP
jgi:hypothetical protein